MKQYNIPLGGYMPVEGVIYLMENDISQINKIPFLQNYEGYAIVTIGHVYLNADIDIKTIIEDQSIIKDESSQIFIINCEHSDLSDRSLIMTQKLDVDRIHCCDSLREYFSKDILENTDVVEENQEDLKKHYNKEF